MMATEKKAEKAKRPTAKKRDIQNEKQRDRNRAFKASIRTAIRSFEETLEKGDSNATKESLNNVFSVMDRSVKRGIFQLNKASRTKARLSAKALAKG